ncbi:RNA polymerase sigma factor [Planctomyces sp. SH-PL62]|uniref:RNA polymerase sigma factor n=1 Tax=Planctomyces sp. SH-PL62 TaxID=1636152 RepID=UPI00078D3C1D|nr:RNA polymerase sigma factor [Planctomyces sp. SH-PL62]AMV36883.1 ECF RNA polymerase sigma factor SigW [Planctomyces sp. SH-PL62]
MLAEQADPPDDRSGLTAEPLADEEIVRRVVAGDTAAFELLMRRYNQLLFRVARSILGNDSEAEDVVQEAYLHAFEHLPQFEGRSRFSTWLTKIAVHEAMGRLRKQRRLRLVAPADVGEEAVISYADDRDGFEEASLKELHHLLVAAVDALPQELRVVFTLRMVERLSTEQTAECLNLRPGNVKVRLYRARSALQRWIDHRIGEESRRLYAFDGERCDRIVRNVLAGLGRA